MFIIITIFHLPPALFHIQLWDRLVGKGPAAYGIHFLVQEDLKEQNCIFMDAGDV